jgi:hypothetical protein
VGRLLVISTLVTTSGMAKTFHMAKKCVKPKKRPKAPVAFLYKKKFLGVGVGSIRTLRAAASRGALCAAPWGGNIENRAHQCNVPAPTAVPNPPTTCSSVGWAFLGHALHHCPCHPSLRTLRAPPYRLLRGVIPTSDVFGAPPCAHFHFMM